LTAALKKVVSGGQVGVDQAALDVIIDLQVNYDVKVKIGGWCPAGRRAKFGKVPGIYPLRETPDWRYQQRTEWNVRDSDATILLYRNLSPGTALTKRLAKKHKRPCYEFTPNPVSGMLWSTEMVIDELREFETINVAGNSGNSPQNAEQVHEWASAVLENLFCRLLSLPFTEPMPL
jgi:hypothetical protein